MFNIIMSHSFYYFTLYLYIHVLIYNNKNLYFNGMLCFADTVLQYRVSCDS